MNLDSVFNVMTNDSFLVLDLLFKSTALLGVALLVTRLLRPASAAVRHFVWIVALLGCLALPILSLSGPRWTIDTFAMKPGHSSFHPVPKSEAASSRTSTKTDSPFLISTEAALLLPTTQKQTETKITSSSLALSASKAANDFHWIQPLGTGLTLLWLAGVFLLLSRLALMYVRLKLFSRTCTDLTSGPLFDGLQECCQELSGPSSVRLLVTEKNSMPMTWGIRRATILLPQQAHQWSENELRCTLLHELAHVSRRDCLTQLFVQLASALCWFNPLTWVASRSVLIERELACDDLVLQTGTRASDYADQLLQVVSRFQTQRLLQVAAVSMASRYGLTDRLKSILQETRDRRPVRQRTRLTIAFLFLSLTFVSGITQVSFTETATAQQADLNLPGVQQSQASSLVQQSIQEPLPPQVLSGKRRTPALVQNQPAPAVRSLNIVFAHDPGIGNYDGIVGRPNDVWNSVDIGTTAVDYTRYSDATPSTARLRITRHDGEWGIKGQSGIFQGYIYHNCQCVDLSTKVLDLPGGKYKIYVFAHGDAPDQNAEIELKVGNRVIGKKATASDGTWNYRNKPYQEGVQYVSFEFTKTAGEVLDIISHRADSGYSMFNAIQIVPLDKPVQTHTFPSLPGKR